MTPRISFTKRYAHGATTLPSNSRAEIERTLARFGCKKFGCVMDPPQAAIFFEHNNRRIRFTMPDPKAILEPYNAWPTTNQIEAEERRLWRSLLMCIKAKLDMVESGITTFDVEFLPYMQLSDGRTFAEAAAEPEFEKRLTSIGRPSLLALGQSESEPEGVVDAEFAEATP